MQELKDLLVYLKENVYSKMDKKDVEEIKSVSLAGGLMDMVNRYKDKCVLEAIEQERAKLELDISSLKGTIKLMRNEGVKTNERYRKNSVID